MRKLPVIIAVFAAVVVLLTGCGASQKSSNTSTQAGPVLSRAMQSKTMNVGIEGTYEPFDFLNKQNQYDGFDVDIAKEVAKRMGVNAHFIATPWNGLIGGLQADKFDIILADMSITPERQKVVDFTDPYLISGGVLITRKDTNGITKLADLKGQNVGVGGGTTFEALAESVKGAHVHLYQNAPDYFRDLENGRLDVIINDNILAQYEIKKDNMPLKITSGLLDKDVIGGAVKKGNADFVAKVNSALSDMKKDGTYDQIYMKWFGVKPSSE